MTTITDRLIKGSFWITVSRVVVNALSTLSTIVLAWYLVPEDFGVVAIATTILAIVSTVTDFSLDQVLIRHDAPETDHFSTAWTLGVARGMVLSVLVAAFAYPVSVWFDDVRLVGILLVMSVGLLVSGFVNPRRVMLQRSLVFWQEVTLNISQKVLGFAITVAIAAWYQTYWALVAGALASQVTYVLASYLVMPFRPRLTLKYAAEFFSFSLWVTAGQIVNTINWRFDYLLIGKFLGGANLGYYSLGGTLAATPTREATAPLTAVIYPAFANVRQEPARLAAAYQRAQAIVTAIALPAGIGTAVIADPLVRLALGEKWLPVIFIIQALASVYALQTLGSLCQPLGMALGNTRLLFIRDTQMLFVRVPLITAGLLIGGMQGLILARVFTGVLAAVVNMFLVKRLTDLKVGEQLWANFRSLASVTVMALGVYLADRYSVASVGSFALLIRLACLVGLGALLYCGSMTLMWLCMAKPEGPETEVRKLVTKIFSRLRTSAA